MGERIKELRKRLGLTQAEFAEKIGMAAGALTNYEKGRRTPVNSVVNNICKTFGISEEWLRTGTGEMYVSTKTAALERLTAEFALDDFLRGIVSAYLDLPPSGKEAMRLFIVETAKRMGVGSDAEEGQTAEERLQAIMDKAPSDRTEEELDFLAEDFRRRLADEKRRAEEQRASPGAENEGMA